MTTIQLLPIIVSLLLLGAHFMRAGEPLLLAASLSSLVLLFVRRPWAARTLQLILLLGAIEWLRTMTSLVFIRQEAGLPYMRAALIIAAVGLLTGASALLFLTARISRRYHLQITA